MNRASENYEQARKRVGFSESVENNDGMLFTFKSLEPSRNFQENEKNVFPAGFKYPREYFDKKTDIKAPGSSAKEALSKKEIINMLDLPAEAAGSSEDYLLGMKKLVRGKGELADEVITHLDKQILKIQKKRDDLEKRKQFKSNDRGKSGRQVNSDFDEEDLVLNLNGERDQLVSHYTSSLQNPNLQNLEALLKAHRLKLAEVEDQYWAKKNSGPAAFRGSPGKKRISAQEKRYQELRKKYLKGPQKSRPITVEEKETYIRKFEDYKQNKLKHQNQKKSKSPVKIENSAAQQLLDEKSEKELNAEKDLLRGCYAQIPTIKEGLVSKMDVIKYISKSPNLLRLYSLEDAQINMLIRDFPSPEITLWSFEIFFMFFKIMRVQAERMEIKEKKQTNEPQGLYTGLLRPDMLSLLLNIYKSIDTNNDNLVSREDLVKSLSAHPKIKAALVIPVVYLPSIQKSLNLGRVIKQIEQDGSLKSFSARREEGSEKFITWEQFKAYFGSEKPYKADLERRLTQEKLKRDILERNIDDQNDYVIQEDIIEDFKRIFDSMRADKIEGRTIYVDVLELLEKIRSTDRYAEISRTPGREKAKNYDLKDETIEEVLNRLENEAENTISKHEFLQYFTKRGRPIRRDQALRTEKQDYPELKDITSPPEFELNEEYFSKMMDFTRSIGFDDFTGEYLHKRSVEGYDSDPEEGAVVSSKRQKPRKEVLDNKGLFEEQKQFRENSSSRKEDISLKENSKKVLETLKKNATNEKVKNPEMDKIFNKLMEKKRLGAKNIPQKQLPYTREELCGKR